MHLPGKKFWVMDYSQHAWKGALPWEWPSEIKKKITKAKVGKTYLHGEKKSIKNYALSLCSKVCIVVSFIN